MKTITRPCPLCNSHEHTGLTSFSSEWPLAQCDACSMVFLREAPDVGELFENLAWDKTTVTEEKRREDAHGKLRQLSKLSRARLHMVPRKNIRDLVVALAPSGDVLDVGSGRGHHVLALPERYTPFAIEVSTFLASENRDTFESRGGLMVNADGLKGLQQFGDDKFAVIVMRSYLEHDVHPLPILKEVFRTLEPGGLTIIKVPNYNSLNRKVMGEKWCGFRFPDHVNYFTPRTLVSMVRSAGLTVARFNWLDRLPTSDNMWLFAAKPARLGSPAAADGI